MLKHVIIQCYHLTVRQNEGVTGENVIKARCDQPKKYIYLCKLKFTLHSYRGYVNKPCFDLFWGPFWNNSSCNIDIFFGLLGCFGMTWLEIFKFACSNQSPI